MSGKRLNPFQHAYQRPDMYIGTKITTEDKILVYQDEVESLEEVEDQEAGEEVDDEQSQTKSSKPKIHAQLAFSVIKYNAGLTRIFVEIMSNAIDNKWRSDKEGVPCKRFDFTIDNDPSSEYFGWITIVNDGKHIPVEKSQIEYVDHRTGETIYEDMYPAESFFGDFFSGTNLSDEESDGKRMTSGRNGIGGKAAIVYSKEFIIEHSDPEAKKLFYQSYSDNGKIRSKPKITSYQKKTAYTSISFLPDYNYFGYEGMDDELFSLLKRYVYDCAMLTGLSVTLNGEKIVVKDLDKYARLAYPDTKSNAMFHFKAPNGDQCVIVENGNLSSDNIDDVTHVSWVNGIYTKNGGLHVNAWRDMIFPAIVKEFNASKHGKQFKVSAKELYSYFTLFVVCNVDKPSFDSQTKDKLNGPKISLFDDKKSQKEFKEGFASSITKMMKWGFISLVIEKLSFKADKILLKKEGNTKRKTSFGKKALDANEAGGKYSDQCTLYITEGDSAKKFAEALISQYSDGSDYYGCVAIRGKFLNVQSASLATISKNVEVKLLKDIINLATGVDYSIEENRKTLRYGKVVIMTDQDDDGFHIRGLLLNFFYTLWPSLYDLKFYDNTPFIASFTTVVILTKKRNKIEKMFFSNPEFRDWREELGGVPTGISVKYYKGLGTHQPIDTKLYCDNPLLIQYEADEEANTYMDRGFNKSQTAWRKARIMSEKSSEDDLVISGSLSLSNFVKSQLPVYLKMTVGRALPNMYDSFKDSHRKVFFGISNNTKAKKDTVNLENLIGFVKNMTYYHHGGISLENTIKKMAQGFVGSNNIPLLKADGMFGTRSDGGKTTAAARYVFTGIEPIAWSIFRQEDEPLLERNKEDDTEVEYKMYFPVVPMILINGASGIASGWSTDIPNYNPEDIVSWILKWLETDEDREVDIPALVPWYRGFNGTNELLIKEGKVYKVWDPVEDADKMPNHWRSKGVLKEGSKGWWSIEELPIGMWSDDMKAWLEYLWTGNPPAGSKKQKIKPLLLENRMDAKKGTNVARWDIKPTKEFIPDMEVSGNFKNMQKVESLTNMHVIDENGIPRKYSCPEDLLRDFCTFRLNIYGKRIEYWLEQWKRDIAKESSKYKYIKAVIDGELNMHQDDDSLYSDMEALELYKENESFDYLLSMQMKSMTKKRLTAIEHDIEAIKLKIEDYENNTSVDIWRRELLEFMEKYKKFLKTRNDNSKE